jgi:hypothetical protein
MLPEIVAGRVAEEPVAVGVHFQHATAGFDGAGLAALAGVEITAGIGVIPGSSPTIAWIVSVRAASSAWTAFFLFCHIAPKPNRCCETAEP